MADADADGQGASAGDQPPAKDLNGSVGLTRSEAASKLGVSVKNFPKNLQITKASIATARSLTSEFSTLIAVVLVLFIVHQLFLWVDQDPDTAFQRAALFLEVVEVVWDTVGIAWNAATDIVNSAVIPIWNAGSFYIVEPAVVLVLEVFSLAFARKHWTGLYDEADFPYAGFDCLKDELSAEWCGKIIDTSNTSNHTNTAHSSLAQLP